MLTLKSKQIYCAIFGAPIYTGIPHVCLACAGACCGTFALKLWQCGSKNSTKSIKCSKYFSINRFKKSLRIRTLIITSSWLGLLGVEGDLLDEVLFLLLLLGHLAMDLVDRLRIVVFSTRNPPPLQAQEQGREYADRNLFNSYLTISKGVYTI